MSDKKQPTESGLPDHSGREPPSAIFEGDAKSLEVRIAGDFARITAASENNAVASGILRQLSSLGAHRKQLDVESTNFALGFVDAMQPKDAAELLILTQMAATHQAVMMFARRLNHVDNIAQQDSAERAYNKLVRSYAAQMDTLKRYRSKGQQVVRVERVTVNEGGQAIVGNVQRKG